MHSRCSFGEIERMVHSKIYQSLVCTNVHRYVLVRVSNSSSPLEKWPLVDAKKCIHWYPPFGHDYSGCNLRGDAERHQPLFVSFYCCKDDDDGTCFYKYFTVSSYIYPRNCQWVSALCRNHLRKSHKNTKFLFLGKIPQKDPPRQNVIFIFSTVVKLSWQAEKNANRNQDEERWNDKEEEDNVSHLICRKRCSQQKAGQAKPSKKKRERTPKKWRCMDTDEAKRNKTSARPRRDYFYVRGEPCDNIPEACGILFVGGRTWTSHRRNRSSLTTTSSSSRSCFGFSNIFFGRRRRKELYY